MKQVTRTDAPHPLNCSETKRSFYEDLYDETGTQVKKRWNVVRDALSEMSGHHCAYCGKKAKVEVDHFFPKNKRAAPYLAYCWENLIPACHDCNQRKLAFFPRSLSGKRIIESCAEGVVPHDLLYEKSTIMEIASNDRLLDPTFDRVEEHLTLDCEFFCYNSHTKIGEITKERFFGEAFERNLEKLSHLAKKLVSEKVTVDILNPIFDLYGDEFYLRAYYEYWYLENAEGRMR
ncbi:HNH endonuclease [Tumebacillus flagellatus]|uniref:HNH nuclease domain-containing protein n=1 Tax=Tumebacillus flagellatus TaxID=1157490 RepID=A0A074MGL8_9BACL|nr:HNH endonuclease [Tumebacillus flagellatus]KEO84867.1 hypothetical protein EL26_02330 [Tumebacillus flagellatus]